MIRAIALSVCLSLLFGGRVHAGEFVQPREEDLRILEVRLDEEILSDELTAYQHQGGGILLPVGEVARLLALAITVKPEDGTAQGFVARQDRTFFLDTGRHEITLSGKRSVFDPDLVEVHEDDLYADSTLLSEWLQIELDADLFALRLRVRPREPLPLQLRRQRESRMNQSSRGQRPDPGYPIWKNPYDLFTLPFIDQTFRLGYRSGVIEAEYTTYATADLLGMESDWYVHGNRDEQMQDFRLTLGRKDPDGRLFLGSRELAVGDVPQPGSALVSSSRIPHPGVLISSYPLERPTQFASNSFYGDLPPGWDVELYQNNALTGYQTAREDGRYAFENVPLLFGYNFFQLVFYGPQGQRRVENHQFVVGASQTPPGAAYYRVVANQERAWTGPAAPGDVHGYRALVQTDIGIFERLSAAAEVSTLPLQDRRHDYAKLGLRGYLGFLSAYADFVEDRKGGSASEAGLQTRVLGISINASHSALTRDYVSELFPLTDDPVARRDRLRLDMAIPAWLLPRIPITFEANQDQFYSGRTRTRLGNRVSIYYRGFSAANELRWDRESGSDPFFQGSFQLSRTVRGHSLRGEVIYRLMTLPGLSSVNLSADGFLTPRYRYSISVTRAVLSEQDLLTIGVNKILGKFAAGVQAQYDTRGNLGVNLNLSVGVGLEPRTDRVVTDAGPIAGSGAASVRAFLDQNINGKLDPGEEPIEHVAFSINGSQARTVTDKRGIALLTQLPAYRPLDLGLAAGTLEDPAWTPTLKGVRFTPRPGKAVEVDFPVVLTGEIDGTVRTVRLGQPAAAGGVTLHLTDGAGRVIQETKSAYDGYYLFTAVVPGEYELRIAPTEVARIGLVNPPVRPLTIAADGTILSGVDLALRTRTEEPRMATNPETLPSSPPAPMQPATSAQPTATAIPTERAWALQVGAYRIRENAETFALEIGELEPPRYIAPSGRLHLVLVGPFDTREEAAGERRRLASAGVKAFIVPARPPQRPPFESADAVSQKSGGYNVQVGAYRLSGNVIALLRRIETLGFSGFVTRERDLSIVRVGPFATPEAAVNAVRTLARYGIGGAVFTAPRRRR